MLLTAVMLSVPLARAEDRPPDTPPMRFAVVRSNAPGCEPNCPEWISAEGSIEAGTPSLLKRTLKALKGRKLPLVVNSPGGNVEAALTLGRLIRKAGLDVAVGKTVFSGCQPDLKACQDPDRKGSRYFGDVIDYGAMCNSACPLMFAGGARRLVGEWAFLGVHQITTTYVRTRLQYLTTYRIVGGKKKVLKTKIVGRKNTGSYKTYEMSKAVAKRLAAYLKEMGVDQGVLEAMKSTPASEIHQITLDDMLAMKLVTGPETAELLTSASLCGPDRSAANCREVPGTKPDTGQTAEAKAIQPSVEPEGVQRTGDMRFVVVRGSNPLCNPDCPEWISAEGMITARTPEKLRQALDAVAGRRLPVVISSQGGDVEGAIAAGRLIREHKLDVVVAHTDIVDCDPSAECLAKDGIHTGLTVESQGECGAACPIMVAGGVRRLIGSSARLSVGSLGSEDKVEAYLVEMAVRPGLFAISSSQQRVDQATALKFGLATGRQSADELTGATICRSVPRPDNCRVMPSANAQADMPAKL